MVSQETQDCEKQRGLISCHRQLPVIDMIKQDIRYLQSQNFLLYIVSNKELFASTAR